jgi:hypothetical protein
MRSARRKLPAQRTSLVFSATTSPGRE